MANKLSIAAAGSGKTTYLVEAALKCQQNVLITTFTEANEQEIRKKIFRRTGYIPSRITIQTWFSFLLQHGVRPYQSCMNSYLDSVKIGFYLQSGRSGFRYHNNQGKPVYWGEKDFAQYYFTRSYKIYSDKISKFVYECNKNSKGMLFDRITKIFPNIFVDEVQDLAGWDLELIKKLVKSRSTIVLVGDPRQATYSTNDSPKYKKYRGAGIVEFFREKIPTQSLEIDTETLNRSHRNSQEICSLSSGVYQLIDGCKPCECDLCRNKTSQHTGIFVVRPTVVTSYTKLYSPLVLRWSGSIKPEMNFGASKGCECDHVLIYPTRDMVKFITQSELPPKVETQAKLYVAITRARHSVAFVYDYKDQEEFPFGMKKYSRRFMGRVLNA